LACVKRDRAQMTDEGKVIVRSHDNDRNAQLIHKEFLHVMTESTEAMTDSGELLAHLTSVRIADGAWRGTAKAFVLNWIDKLRLHHEVTPSPDRLPETTQRVLLQNSVIGVIASQEVQTSADLMKATNGSVLTFTQCRTLLINAATSYDKRTDAKSSSDGRPRRSDFTSETDFGLQDGPHEDVVSKDDTCTLDYDVDASPAESHACVMHQRERPQFKAGSRMPIARWKALSKKAKTIWDTVEDEDKLLILFLQEKQKEGATPSDRSKFSVNAHDTASIPAASADNIDDVLLAVVTKHSIRPKPSSHPGDIRSVLSQPVKAPATSFKDHEISVNGHKCLRQVQSHELHCSVSQASRKKKSSLIDRGANGGIAGVDTRVIERHPHRAVDVRGVDDHEITYVPIVTAGAIARSQRGEVIFMMNQHACHPQQGRSIDSSCQLEAFNNDVNDKSIHIPGGLQRIQTPDGCVFPLSVRDGLPCLGMRPHTDAEFDSLPHVILTSDVDWNPRVLDFDIDNDDAWCDAISDNANHSELFDVFGNYKGRLDEFKA
jgi:hypothetical protein